jgi:hypothetical protein
MYPTIADSALTIADPSKDLTIADPFKDFTIADPYKDLTIATIDLTIAEIDKEVAKELIDPVITPRNIIHENEFNNLQTNTP